MEKSERQLEEVTNRLATIESRINNLSSVTENTLTQMKFIKELLKEIRDFEAASLYVSKEMFRLQKENVRREEGKKEDGL